MSSQDIRRNDGFITKIKQAAVHLYIRLHTPVVRLLNEKTDLVEKEIAHLDADIRKYLENYERLQENVRNINQQLESYESLVENVRNTNRQLEGYESLIENVRNTNQQLEGYQSLIENVRNINQQLEGFADLTANMSGIRQDLERISVNVRNNNAELGHMESTLDMHSIKISAMQKKLDDASDKPGCSRIGKEIDSSYEKTGFSGRSDDKENLSVNIASKNENMNQPVSSYGGIDYFDFENHFRGSRAQIKKNQEIYLKYFQGRQHVLDLGCGRGEFLELLSEHGIQGYGVDLYEEFVELCQQKQLYAVQGDALAFLEQEKETDGIFAGQLIEHLPLEQLIRLTELAYEKLTPGSFLVLETPNPMSLAIYTNSFYMDPSHNKPVHPLTLKYLLEKAGFQEIELIFTESSKLPVQIPRLDIEQAKGIEAFNHAMKEVERSLYGSQDYAIVARK